MSSPRALPPTPSAATKHAREYETIIGALHPLEKALASPAPRREEEWKRTHAALAVFIDRLQAHCRAAESDGGVLTEAEVHLGRTRAVSRAHLQHERMLRDARELLADLRKRADHPSLTPAEVRRRAARLATALRAHQALEADIIIEAFERDIGGED
jgi:hypothetical protein